MIKLAFRDELLARMVVDVASSDRQAALALDKLAEEIAWRDGLEKEAVLKELWGAGKGAINSVLPTVMRRAPQGVPTAGKVRLPMGGGAPRQRVTARPADATAADFVQSQVNKGVGIPGAKVQSSGYGNLASSGWHASWKPLPYGKG